MRVQYIQSACVVVEHAGKRVLCDPWLTDGIFYGSWYHYPPLAFKPEDFADVDYIYLSHVHPDHMDEETLKRLPRSIKILILEYAEKYFLHILKRLGFQHIQEVPHRGVVSLGPDFSVEVLASDDCNPTLFEKFFSFKAPLPYTRTLWVDSLAVFHGSGKTVVNTNDCLYELSPTACDYIKEKYKTIDLLLVGYGGAGEYPQCFENYDEPTKLIKAAAKKRQFLNQTVRFLKHLRPVWFIPFAGEYTLGGRAAGLNRFRGIPEREELPSEFEPLLRQEKIPTEYILLNSGEWFNIDSGTPSTPFVPPDPLARQRYIDEILSKKKFTYEEEFRIDESKWTDLTQRLQEAHSRLWRYQKEYGYRSDWRVYLDAGQGDLYCVPLDGSQVERVARGREQEPFLRIGIDYSLLNMILNRQAHWNNALPTSHMRFFRQPDIYEREIVHMISYLHC